MAFNPFSQLIQEQFEKALSLEGSGSGEGWGRRKATEDVAVSSSSILITHIKAWTEAAELRIARAAPEPLSQ